MCVCFFKQKTAYEMRISDWSSDVCSSDLLREGVAESPGSNALPELANPRFRIVGSRQPDKLATLQTGRSESPLQRVHYESCATTNACSWRTATSTVLNARTSTPPRRYGASANGLTRISTAPH